MSKVFIGNISQEGNRILTMYLTNFIPEAEVELLSPSGIKGRIKNRAKKSDVLMVIIDETLYQMCVGVADEVLCLPKVHKYVSDNALKDFLVSKFGELNEKSNGVERTTPISVIESVNTDTDSSLIISDTLDNVRSVGSDEVVKLKSELATKESIISNLRSQITEISNESDNIDVTMYIDKINKLQDIITSKEEELNKAKSDSFTDLGKVARAEQVLEDLEKTAHELDLTKDIVTNLQSDKVKLNEKIESLNSNIEDLEAKVERLAEFEDKYNSLVVENTSLSDNFSTCTSELEKLRLERVGLNESISKLEQSISDLELSLADKNLLKEQNEKLIENLTNAESKIAELEKEVSSLKEVEVSLEKLKIDNQSIDLEKSTLAEKIIDLRNIISENKVELDNLNISKIELSSELSIMTDKANSLTNDIDKLTKDLTFKDDDIRSKEDKIERLKSDLTSANNSIAELKEELNTAKSSSTEILDLTSNLESLENKIKEYDSKVTSLKFDNDNLVDEKAKLVSDLKAKTLEYENCKKDIADFSEKEANLISACARKDEELKDAQDKYITLSNDFSNKVSEIDNLSLLLNEKEKEIKKLNTDLNLSNNLVSDKKKLEEDILDLKSKISRLEDELSLNKQEYAKRNEDYNQLVKSLSAKDLVLSKSSNENNELKAQVIALRDALGEYKSSNFKSNVSLDSKVRTLESELKITRERNSKLECDILDKNDQLNEYKNSIFNTMSDFAVPKVAIQLALPLENKIRNNMYVFATGSSESGVSLYQLLKKQVSTDCNRTYLIVDLVTDTYVDRELGVSSVSSPISWLSGSESPSSFLSETKFPNTKVISTALAYINELYFLNVDWNKRLDELQSLADIVIINVGSLDNIVHDILYNSFVKIMKGHIIVKATPINLRTAILHLTGFNSLSNSLISCVEFTEEQSKGLYQKLASRFQSQVLAEGDILQLQGGLV